MWKLVLCLFAVVLLGGGALVAMRPTQPISTSESDAARTETAAMTEVTTDARVGELETRVAPGVITRLTPTLTRGPAYYLYVPRSTASPRRMLVSVHGISRNAREHMEVFQSYAEAYGVVLVAPLFDEKAFRGYQRLVASDPKRGIRRADIGLQRILADVTHVTGMPSDRIYLFGHSGGGQFAHRFAMAYPENVVRYVISAAGWYTVPDLSVPYPYGMKPRRKLETPDMDVDAFLRIPACVVVGADDTERDETLNQAEWLDTTQGHTRVERAEYWVAAMTAAARWRELDTPFDLQVLANAGHDFTEMARRGRVADAVFRCLFGLPVEAAGGD